MKKIINNTGATFWKNPIAPYAAYTITEFELKEELSIETLQHALNDTLVAYPRIAYGCTTEDGKLYCIENNLPLEVQVAEKPLLPNGDTLNGHLISVALWQKRLVIICNHTLTDGTGAKLFISFMMQRYAELAAGTAAEITGPLYDEDLMNEELDVSKIECPKDFQLDPPNPPSLRYVQPKHEIVYTSDGFRISEEGFMSFVKENKTSPTVALGALMAKQILNAMPESDSPVVFDLATNLREHVGLEKTLTNCIDSVSISISREDLKQKNHMETLRATLKRRNSSEYVRYKLCNSGTLSVEELMAMCPTFAVSYTGKVGGAKLNFVEKNNIYRMVSAMPIIDMKAQNGWFNVNVTQDNFNNPLTDMLKNAFREIGLEIYEETKTMVTPENGRITIKQV